MTDKSYKNEEILRSLYWDDGLSQASIGDMYGVNRKTIGYWMDKHEIDTRTHKKDIPGHFDIRRGYARFRVTVGGDEKSVKIHRLLAVAKYGFDKVKNKVVHHKNRIKWDNRYENIELMTHSAHSTHHNKERQFCIGEYQKQKAKKEQKGL